MWREVLNDSTYSKFEYEEAFKSEILIWNEYYLLILWSEANIHFRQYSPSPIPHNKSNREELKSEK